MTREAAFINAHSLMAHLCMMFPGVLSTFTNYESCFSIGLQIAGTKAMAQKFMKELLQGCLAEVEPEMYYNKTIKRWCISLNWRNFK